jgi:hypothetical protein
LFLFIFNNCSYAQHSLEKFDSTKKYSALSDFSLEDLNSNSIIFEIDTCVLNRCIDYTQKVKSKYLNSVLLAALLESEGNAAKLDFKNIILNWYSLQSNTLFYINGKLYNRHEMGNWVWAFCLKYHQCPINAAFAARLQTQITERRADESNEQLALKYGWYWGAKLKKLK